jgi:hypothetical protein
VVNGIADIHVEAPSLTKQRLSPCALRLRFHKYAPELLAIGLALDQQAADKVGGNLFCGAGEEGLRKCCEVLGGCGGYGSGLARKCPGMLTGLGRRAMNE